MSQNTLGRIRNLSPVSSISLALLFFYFIIVSPLLLFNDHIKYKRINLTQI